MIMIIDDNNSKWRWAIGFQRVEQTNNKSNVTLWTHVNRCPYKFHGHRQCPFFGFPGSQILCHERVKNLNFQSNTLYIDQKGFTGWQWGLKSWLKKFEGVPVEGIFTSHALQPFCHWNNDDCIEFAREPSITRGNKLWMRWQLIDTDRDT